MACSDPQTLGTERPHGCDNGWPTSTGTSPAQGHTHHAALCHTAAKKEQLYINAQPPVFT